MTDPKAPSGEELKRQIVKFIGDRGLWAVDAEDTCWRPTVAELNALLAKPALSPKAGEAVAELEDFSRWLARNGMSQGRLVDRTIALIQDQAAEIERVEGFASHWRGTVETIATILGIETDPPEGYAEAVRAEFGRLEAERLIAVGGWKRATEERDKWRSRAETAEVQLKALSGGGDSSLRHQEDGCAPGIEPEQAIETGEGKP